MKIIITIKTFDSITLQNAIKHKIKSKEILTWEIGNIFYASQNKQKSDKMYLKPIGDQYKGIKVTTIPDKDDSFKLEATFSTDKGDQDKTDKDAQGKLWMAVGNFGYMLGQHFSEDIFKFEVLPK